MKEHVLYERVFKAKGSQGGRVVATAKLVSLGNQAPYFSITTARGCDHESILAAMPELKPLVDLHLSDQDGAPMHADANARYHVEQANVSALMRHLRIEEGEARMLIKDAWGAHAEARITYASLGEADKSRFGLKALQECVTRFVDAQRPRWKAEAQAAIELLKGEEYHAEHYDDVAPEAALVRLVDGDTVEVREITTGGYLPRVDLDGEEYYIAASQEDAGAAAEQYWRELAQADKQEFVCLVGEANLLAWSLGEAAGPGSTKVKSLDAWFALWQNTPEEQWASYDGKATTLEINAQAAQEAGLDWSAEDGQDWMSVAAYRCN